MKIKIYSEGNIILPFEGVKKRDIKIYLLKLCKVLKINRASITVIVTDDEYIHKINKDYRNKDKPTDVISFVYRDPPFPEVSSKNKFLGDIFISLEKASSQAKDYEVDIKDEIKRLLVHGLLHLIGYDHERSKEDEYKMQKKEEEVLSRI
ncbi:MAG: rRNA maturation RNase YbeY [Spirochaetota bacterium]|nr:rRNA maturation RNase YbeY [Spirochaetota bacterium]